MNTIIPFRQNAIRKAWHKEEWYFSVVDIMGVLTDQPDHQIARKYWNKLAERLKKEGSEVVTNCHRLKMIAKSLKVEGNESVTNCDQLKMQSADGKFNKTDVVNIKTFMIFTTLFS